MERFNQIPGFGVELKQLEFHSAWDWFIHVEDFWPHWESHKSYLFNQLAFFIGALFTLIHAFKNGGRYKYLWLGIAIHGVVVEMLAYWVPDIDNFWHAQSPIDLFGRRMPLYIFFLYPCFLYQSSVAVSKLRLPNWAEPFAVGLVVVLIDIPYDTTAIKFVHWIWHDTDPNIYDRHYWVPWNSYYFHATFAASFTFWFHGFRRWFCNTKKWDTDSTWKEMLFTVLAGLLGMPGGVLLFIPVYHPLHDWAKLHSENTFFVIFTIFVAIMWSADRQPRLGSRPEKGSRQTTWPTRLLVLHLVIHYTTFLSINLFLNPEDEISIGLHEPVGDCNETSDVHTALGMVLKKRKYLCVTDYDEKYYNFKCLDKVPSSGSIWYTVCGVPYENRIEYITMMITFCIAAGTVFYNLYFRSAPDVESQRKKKQ